MTSWVPSWQQTKATAVSVHNTVKTVSSRTWNAVRSCDMGCAYGMVTDAFSGAETGRAVAASKASSGMRAARLPQLRQEHVTAQGGEAAETVARVGGSAEMKVLGNHALAITFSESLENEPCTMGKRLGGCCSQCRGGDLPRPGEALRLARRRAQSAAFAIGGLLEALGIGGVVGAVIGGVVGQKGMQGLVDLQNRLGRSSVGGRDQQGHAGGLRTVTGRRGTGEQAGSRKHGEEQGRTRQGSGSCSRGGARAELARLRYLVRVPWPA